MSDFSRRVVLLIRRHFNQPVEIKGIQIDTNIDDEKMVTVEPMVEQIVSLLIQLWKEK